MTLAIINDYVLNRRLKLILDEDDFAIVDTNWSSPDELLAGLQHTETFKGRHCWADLEPFHYRIMIVQNIGKVLADVGVAEQLELTSIGMRSLSFLICALVRCLEHRAESHIEMIRLVRVGDIDMAVEYEAALSMETNLPPSEPEKAKGPFAIVVDNTDR